MTFYIMIIIHIILLKSCSTNLHEIFINITFRDTENGSVFIRPELTPSLLRGR